MRIADWNVFGIMNSGGECLLDGIACPSHRIRQILTKCRHFWERQASDQKRSVVIRFEVNSESQKP